MSAAPFAGERSFVMTARPGSCGSRLVLFSSLHRHRQPRAHPKQLEFCTLCPGDRDNVLGRSRQIPGSEIAIFQILPSTHPEARIVKGHRSSPANALVAQAHAQMWILHHPARRICAGGRLTRSESAVDAIISLPAVISSSQVPGVPSFHLRLYVLLPLSFRCTKKLLEL